MGVHGLSTYLRENRRTLSSTVVLPRESRAKPTFVIDGWSFIYNIQLSSNLPWVYGGEYGRFSQTMLFVVRAWLNVGLKIVFVFDGPYPPQKFSTLISRATQNTIQSSVLFFRTSASSRTEPRFLRESRIIPPLAYDTCVQTLEELALEVEDLTVHYADEEGDPYAVELAGRLGAYVVGLDSDFVVFNPADGNYAGYVPFDEMVWSAPAPEEEVVEDDDGFAPVKRPKSKPKPSKNVFGKGIIPPENGVDLTLSFVVYEPVKLAQHLGVPVSLLSLVGALVGNDFSKHTTLAHKNIQNMFFERSMNLSQRINFVGTTLRTALSARKNKGKQGIGSVMDLIDRAVKSLLSRGISLLGTGEVDAITDKIVEATLQYAIPANPGDKGPEGLWPTSTCALHHPDVCALFPYLSRLIEADEDEEALDEDELQIRIDIRELYINAYRCGLLSPMILNPLHSGTYWPRIFLESPDMEATSVTLGRKLRIWMYAVLNDAVGLPLIKAAKIEDMVDGGSKDEQKADKGDDESDDDELVDVVEEDSDGYGSDDDPLASLQGELELLRVNKGQVRETTPSTSSRTRSLISKPKKIVEYVRRGTRLADQVVHVPPLEELLSSVDIEDDSTSPLILRSEEERFTVLLRALGSDGQNIRDLSGKYLLPVLAVRWVAMQMHARATGSGQFVKEREAERWSVLEGKSFLAALTSTEQRAPEDIPDVQILDQNVQRQAHILMTMESIQHFVQTLLLTTRVPFSFGTLSGQVCHAHLTRQIPIPQSVETFWPVCTEGLDGVFLEEKRKKKEKKLTKEEPAPVPKKSKAKSKNTSGLFELLAAEDA